MKKLLTFLVLTMSLTIGSAVAEPVAGATQAGGQMVTLTDGQTIQLPSNAQLAEAVGATDKEMFTPLASDKSLWMLTAILGTEIWGIPSTDGHGTIFNAMMGTWNVAVMVLGVVFVAYILMSGLIKTAHEGEVLGRQWSSVWIPLRTGASFALILPVAGGYCLAQVMVAWMATVGIGLADGMWLGVQSYLTDTHASVVKPVDGTGKDRVFSAWHSVVCMEAVQKMRPDSKMEIMDFKPRFASLGLGDEPAGFMNFGFTFGDSSGTYSRDMCGGFSWGATDTLETASAAGGLTSMNLMSNAYDSIFGTGKNGQDQMGEVLSRYQTDEIVDGQRMALWRAAEELRPAAKEFVRTGISPDMKVIATAIANYNKSVEKGVGEAAKFYLDENIKTATGRMAQDGWVYAGAYFMKIIHLNDKLRELAHASPDDIDVNFDAWEGDDEGQFQAIIAASEVIQREYESSQKVGVVEGYKDETGSQWAHPMYAALGLFVKEIAEPDRHPIIALQRLGNYLMDGIWVQKLLGGRIKAAGAVVAGKAGKKAAAIKSGGSRSRKDACVGAACSIAQSGGQAVNDHSQSVGDWMFDALLLAAIILAAVIPLLPFIIWSMDVLGWLIAVLVSLVAAPVWMVMHMHPEGHEVAGHGAPGYTLLLSVCMKAPLMVISLIIAMVLSWVMVTFVAGGWMYATASANSGTMFGPGLAAASMLLFAITMSTIVYKSFALIHGIQSEILQWIGGRDHDLGGAQGQITAIGGIAGGMASRGLALSGKMSQSRAEVAGRAREASRDAAAQATEHAATSRHQEMVSALRGSGGGNSSGGNGQQSK